MQFETFALPHILGGMHLNNNATLFTLTLSVDLHQSYSAQADAVEGVYGEALLAGAGTLTRETFLDTLGKTGGSITVNITRSILTISLRGQTAAAPTLLKLFSTMIEAPAFSAPEIARIKKNLHNDLELQKEDARAEAHHALQNIIFGAADRRHAAAIPVLQKALEAVAKDALIQLHERARSEPWTVTLSGTKAVATAATKILRALKGERLPNNTKPAHVPKTLDTRVVTTIAIPSKHNVELSIGGPLPLTLHHPDYLPFVFGMAVLGKWGGFAGRLMSTVREKEGLTYSIYGRTESVYGSESGYWRIMTFFAPEKSVTGITSTLREISTIAQKGVSDSEMARFRNILKTQQALLNDSLLSSLSDLHGFLAEGFTLDQIAEFKARLLSVSKAEVNAALRKYLDVDALIISAAGPVSGIKKDLESFAR